MATRGDGGLVVLRADASAEIESGHVVRCLALAEHLRERGARCVFAVRPPALEVVPALGGGEWEVLALTAPPGAEARELRVRLSESPRWLVVDHYERGEGFEQAARAWAGRVLALDDLPSRPHDCDVLLDPTLGRERAAYRALVPERCALLLGPAYALLRRQFAAARAGALERRAQASGVERILVSFGGTDPYELTLTALEGVRLADLHASVDVVVGPAAPYLGAVRERAAQLPFPVEVHAQVSDMASLMTCADLAIGAAGTTSWERCCLGLPSLTTVVAANQADIAESLARAGAARMLGDVEDFDARALSRALKEVAGDREGLARMSRVAAGVCDGLGAARVADLMVSGA